jgi:hypothetical protein
LSEIAAAKLAVITVTIQNQHSDALARLKLQPTKNFIKLFALPVNGSNYFYSRHIQDERSVARQEWPMKILVARFGEIAERSVIEQV